MTEEKQDELLVTYRYIRDGQERVITGTQKEIDDERAGVPFQPLAPKIEEPIKEPIEDSE